MPNSQTFLTQIGNENYDLSGKIEYDMGTSQSTLLLQKQKKMQEVQSELESAMIHGENHKVECLSFNFSLKPNGGVAVLSIVQKDEAGEAVGGEVRT